MAKQYDAASKYIVDNYPGDWLRLAGLTPQGTLELIDTDLSTVTTAADRLIKVNAPDPYAAHVEFQTSPDDKFDDRVLVYNVLAKRRLEIPVLSIGYMLRPQAAPPSVTGRVMHRHGADHALSFTYKLVRVWELSPNELLTGGLGTLPLAPISAVNEPELPDVIEAMKLRLSRELPPPEIKEIWTAARILMGLRFDREAINQLLRGVRDMEDSVTYQEILKRGEERGMSQGLSQGLSQGREAEARRLLLYHAEKRFGAAEPGARQKINAAQDVHLLEAALDRLLDGLLRSWPELLDALKTP